MEHHLDPELAAAAAVIPRLDLADLGEAGRQELSHVPVREPDRTCTTMRGPFNVAHFVPGTAIGARMIADRRESIQRLLVNRLNA